MARAPLAVVGVALLALLTGCDRITQVCTQIGAESGVIFEDVAAALPDGSRYRVLACARGECVEWQGERSDLPLLQVVLANVTQPTSVRAALTVWPITTPAAALFDASTRVDLTIFQPNGPGCPPTVIQGRVRATIAGDLVPA